MHRLPHAGTLIACATVLLTALAGCQLQPLRTAVQRIPESSREVDIGRVGLELGASAKTYEVPLQLEKVPREASLVLDFKVIDKGHCPVTYEPTEVKVNGGSIASIDFREYTFASRQTLQVDIPPALLRTGANLVSIHSGACQYDIDVMHFNRIKLLQN